MNQLGISGDDQYAVTYNGAVICSANGKVIYKELLSNDQYCRLTAFGKENKIPFNVLDEHSVIYTADHDVGFVTVIQAWENEAGIMIRQPEEMPQDFQITKGVFCGQTELLDSIQAKVEATFSDEMYVVRAGKWFLETMHKNVNKGNSLDHLSQALGLTPDEVMVFGDEGNDLAMFEFADTAVCMGNGSDKAKAYADFVTKSNDDDGIALAFDKFIFNA